MKFLEEKGIGRPSTFATIVTTIIQRGYVKHEGKSLVPTDLGVVTTRLMLEHFPDIVGYDFTAHMEEQLDDIENGGKDMVSLLSDFYKPFEEHLEKAMKEADEQKIRVAPEETDIFCEKCGARMVVKNGRFGRFAACPNYPECRNTKPLEKDGKTLKEPKEPEIVSGMVCEKCGGPMVQREGRYGSFFACANYPKCTYTKQPVNELEVHCPLCGKKLVTKKREKPFCFLQLQRLSRMQFFLLGSADQGEMPPVRRNALCEKREESSCLSQQGLRLHRPLRAESPWR